MAIVAHTTLLAFNNEINNLNTFCIAIIYVNDIYTLQTQFYKYDISILCVADNSFVWWFGQLAGRLRFCLVDVMLFCNEYFSLCKHTHTHTHTHTHFVTIVCQLVCNLVIIYIIYEMQIPNINKIDDLFLIARVVSIIAKASTKHYYLASLIR